MIALRCLIEGLIPGVRFGVPSWTRNKWFRPHRSIVSCGATLTSFHVIEIGGLTTGNCERDGTLHPVPGTERTRRASAARQQRSLSA